MPSPRPSVPSAVPLNPGTAAALPLGSRSHSSWATALVGLGETGPALVEVTTAGVVRWWAPQHDEAPDPLDLVWARLATRDVEVAGLLLGPLAARSPGAWPGDPSCASPVTAAVVASKAGGYTLTIGGWPDDIAHASGRGSVIDALLLYLRLPTAPEQRPPAMLVCAMWLDRLLAVAAAEPGGITDWAAASVHHPLAHGPTGAAQLIAAARSLTEAGWRPMRLAVADRSAKLAGLTPRGARWMDEGAFARWLLDRYPSPDESIEALSMVLPRRLADTVADTVTATLA
ncbi:MAG: hypothetical protein R2754_07940 [Microthrixaceae bacterium]